MDTSSTHTGNSSFPTLGALLLFFFAVVTAIGLCASAVIRKRRVQIEQAMEVTAPVSTEESASGWREIKKVPCSSLCLGDASQAEETERSHWQEKEVRVAVAEAASKGRCEEQPGMTCAPPLWQRRILMGERCEMPEFSGLILYDEHGRPLNSNNSNKAIVQMENPATPVTTLKDLLQLLLKDGDQFSQ